MSRSSHGSVTNSLHKQCFGLRTHTQNLQIKTNFSFLLLTFYKQLPSTSSLEDYSLQHKQGRLPLVNTRNVSSISPSIWCSQNNFSKLNIISLNYYASIFLLSTSKLWCFFLFLFSISLLLNLMWVWIKLSLGG